MALQSRDAAQGLARYLCDRRQAVCRGARQRSSLAPGQVRQSRNVELSVRVRVGLIHVARMEGPQDAVPPGLYAAISAAHCAASSQNTPAEVAVESRPS